jgi:carotenoid 1,2-hydratase
MFTREVSRNGYCWWYMDAESADQQHRLTIIAFIGSVFSPYYKRARNKSAVDPLQHCSLNVALYGANNVWCMTERHREDVELQPDYMRIGPSSLSYTRSDNHTGRLTINIEERAAPIPRRVKGQITVDIQLQTDAQFTLDDNGRHHWWPAGPNSQVSVQMERPFTQWTGNAYVDMNQGDQPIENDLQYWCWSRFRTASGTQIHYDVFNTDSQLSGNPDKAIAVHIGTNSDVQPIKPSTLHELPRSGWRMRRHARSDASVPKIISALEDTPFYTRSAVRTGVNQHSVNGINESVSLTRFNNPIVQTMLRFRMPRLRWQKRSN